MKIAIHTKHFQYKSGLRELLRYFYNLLSIKYKRKFYDSALGFFLTLSGIKTGNKTNTLFQDEIFKNNVTAKLAS